MEQNHPLKELNASDTVSVNISEQRQLYKYGTYARAGSVMRKML